MEKEKQYELFEQIKKIESARMWRWFMTLILSAIIIMLFSIHAYLTEPVGKIRIGVYISSPLFVFAIVVRFIETNRLEKARYLLRLHQLTRENLEEIVTKKKK